ncbi:Importin N-terminal domain-containing protein [Plasmodiophora brassicae]|uniref:Importin N-terminal domain-containing protein n=1 Tax=Plasmodiophora brassicae TaxID=37360 RepID=A0A0G4IY68_PLABS|nr:hypothetical protein PBRA_007818 [Plasmodiophora brassicae]SPR00207.1 unnamed protein product [Plasmodiophora brassicae]
MHDLLALLGALQSPSAPDRQAAERRLQSAAQSPDLLVALVGVVANAGNAYDHRLLAVVLFKNYVTPLWPSVPPALKDSLRRQLLSMCLDSSAAGRLHSQLMVIVADLVAAEWSSCRDGTLLTAVLNTLRARAHRAVGIDILHQICRSSVDNPNGKRWFPGFAGAVAVPVWGVFQTSIGEGGLSPESMHALAASTRLVIAEVDLQELGGSVAVLTYLRDLLASLVSGNEWSLSQFLVEIVGMLNDATVRRPLVDIEPFAVPVLEIIIAGLSACPDDVLLVGSAPFITWSLAGSRQLCLSFNLRSAIKCDPELAQAFIARRDQFFTFPRCLSFVQSLLERYVMHRRDEIECWGESTMSQASPHRTAVESILRALSRCYPSMVREVTHQILHGANASASPLLLEAALFSLGVTLLSTDNLFDVVPVPSVMSNPSPQVRRRLAWLLKFGAPSRDALHVVAHLACHDQDMVVRLEAVSTLEEFARDRRIAPELGAVRHDILLALLDAFDRTCEPHSHETLIRSLTLWAPSASLEAVIARVPALWDAVADHNAQRSALIALVNVVLQNTPTTDASPAAVFPILHHALDTQQADHVYLGDSALSLWLTVVQRAATLLPVAFELFTRHWPSALIEDVDARASVCFQLVESYALVAGDAFLNAQGATISSVIVRILPELPGRHFHVLADALLTIATVSPGAFLAHLHPVLTALLQKMVSATTPDEVAALAPFLSVFGVSIAREPNDMLSWMATQAGGGGGGIDRIVDIWLRQFSSITTAFARKVAAIGLCTLIISPQYPTVLPRVRDALRCASLVQDASDLHLPVDLALERNRARWTEAHRRQKMVASDPIVAVNVAEFVNARLRCLQTQIGPLAFDELIRNQ